MMGHLKPYPAYKDSGVEWLGKVPEHWEVRRLGSVTQILNGATPSSSMPEYWDGDIVWVTPDDLGKLKGRYIDDSSRRITREGYNACGTTLAPAGSIVVSTRAPIGHLGILRVAACANQGCRLLVPQTATASEYLYHVLVAARPSLEVLGQGSTFLELSRSNLRAFPIPFPPLPEQTAIVRFLDWAERRIRRVIRARQRRIKLLEEYKQALIHRAVTGQIDVRTGQPYPAYKPSGVEWLGDVPAHWEILPLKWLAKCYRNGATPPTTKDFYYIGGTIPWYGPSSFDSGEIVSTPVHFISNTAIEDGVARLIRGPALLVVVIGATAGRMTLMEQDGTTNQQITAFELPYDWKTCLFLLRQLRFSESWLRETASTATIPILNTNIVTHLPCLMPPPKERCAIVEYLDAQTAKLDAAIAAARREIELLREYRTRLIADVVTGKVDVREVAARLPEEPAEEEAELEDTEETAEGEAADNEAAAETFSEEEVEP